jgi:tetratricopeptide (TPR) repeat protein
VKFPGWSLQACQLAPVVVALLACGEGLARAESGEPSVADAANPDRQRALELYDEGALLLGAGRYWEAELRFQESFKLLKGRGTLLNLAICHENLGKLASAWRELKALEEQASAAGDSARLETAREHLAWIEPQLSYLNVNLSPESQLPGLQVELDGEPLSKFGVLFPIDPGRHQLRASAPGKKAWSFELAFQNGNQRQNVTIPSLEEEDLVPAVPRLPPAKAVPVAQHPPAPLPKADYSGVYIAGAATVTLTVGAVVSAFLYYDRRTEYHDAVSHPESVSEAEQSARRDAAERMAWINGSLIVGASVGAAVTGVLWYRAWHAVPAAAGKGAWVAPFFVGSGAGLSAGASF